MAATPKPKIPKPKAAKPRVPKAKPYDPLSPLFPTLPAARGEAGRRADADVAAGMGAVNAEFGTPATIQHRYARQGADIGALSAALAKQLQGNQLATVNMAGAVPGLMQSAYGNATQGAAGAAIAAGGQAGSIPGQAQGLGLTAQLGANLANSLMGGVQAAQSRGTLDQKANLNAMGDALTERANEAMKIKSQRGSLQNTYLKDILDSDFQRGAAGDNSRLGYSSLGLDREKMLIGAQMDQANLDQRASSDAAKLAQDRAEFDWRRGLDQAKLKQAQQKIDLDLKKLEQQVAKGKIPAAQAKTRRRDAITRSATSLVRQLRSQTTTEGGSPATTRPTGQYKYTFTINWMEPGETAIDRPTPKNKPFTVTTTSPEEAKRQVEAAFGNLPQMTPNMVGDPVPVTEKVPAVAGTKGQKYTDDRIRGEVFNLYRAYGFPPDVARSWANRLVPGGGSGRSGPPVQADAGDR